MPPMAAKTNYTLFATERRLFLMTFRLECDDGRKISIAAGDSKEDAEVPDTLFLDFIGHMFDVRGR